MTDWLGHTYDDVGAPPKLLSATAAEEEKDLRRATPLALNWWKSHEQVCPLLAMLGEKLLCIPGTSVLIKVFSMAETSSHFDLTAR